MNEVSCRNTHGYMHYFRSFTDVPVEEVFGNLPFSIEYMENLKNWIDWDSYLEIIKRLRRYYPTREDIIDFAVDLNHKTGKYHPITKLVGLAISPLSLYKLGWKWLAPGLMKTLKCRYEMDDQSHIRMIAEIDPQYGGDVYLGYITEGLFINYPSFLGLPDTTVEEVEVTDHYMEMIVTLPPSLTFWARLERIFKAVKVAPAVLMELDEQQEQIRASEERFGSLAHSAVDAIIIINTAGEIQYWNPATIRMFDLQEYLTYQTNLKELLPDWNPDILQENQRSNIIQPLELQGRKSSGDIFPVEVSFSCWHSGGKANFTAIIRDISRRKTAEQNLKLSQVQYRKLAQRLLTVQDLERERISRELHDSMGEYLTTLIMRIGTICRSSGKYSPKMSAELDYVENLAKDMAEECRRISLELSPLMIEKRGLIPAIENMIERWKDHTNIRIRFDLSSGKLNLNTQQELTLYRILQESLTNIYRHAAAESVSVQLLREKDYVRLIVTDDGKGFDYSDELLEAKSGGLGLLSMRERVTAINGAIEICSKSGQGTRINVRLPLEQA